MRMAEEFDLKSELLPHIRPEKRSSLNEALMVDLFRKQNCISVTSFAKLDAKSH